LPQKQHAALFHEISIEKQTSLTTLDTIFRESKAKKLHVHHHIRAEDSRKVIFHSRNSGESEILAITGNCVVEIHLEASREITCNFERYFMIFLIVFAFPIIATSSRIEIYLSFITCIATEDRKMIH
jgi:hypothetical protein